MSLIIENPNNLDLDGFCNYLISILYLESKNTSEFNAKLIGQWNEYLQIVFPDLNLTIASIIESYFKNQIYKEENQNYIVCVDKNTKIDNISIEKIAQTIEVGALDIKGYNIFQQIYQRVADKIPQLYKIWEAKDVS